MIPKTKIGVIGAGAFSEAHIQAILKSKNAELVAIADKDPAQAKFRAEQYGIADWYGDYNELLAREDIVAVTLPLPDQVHKEITVAALKAGKHVLCEKPMALDLQECKDMVRAARESGKQLMVGQVGRYTPGFLEAKRLLESGTIGELFLIESEYAHDYSQIGGQGGWRVTPEREPIIGGGCHAVDLIRMLMNENPYEIFAYANNMSLVDWPIHDCSVGIMKFPSGAIGKVMTSTGCKRKYTMRTVVYGTKGTLVLDNSSSFMTLYKERFTDSAEFDGFNQQGIGLQIGVAINSHNFAAEARDFCSCLLDGRPVTTSGREGAATVAVCTAIVESFKTGEKITVDYNF